jgi:hypothetical protein
MKPPLSLRSDPIAHEHADGCGCGTAELPRPTRLPVADTRPAWGRCGLCNCMSFFGTGEVCQSCGHYFSDHYPPGQ